MKFLCYECDRVYHNSIDKHKIHRREVLKVSEYLNSSKSTIENDETIEIPDELTDNKENQTSSHDSYRYMPNEKSGNFELNFGTIMNIFNHMV